MVSVEDILDEREVAFKTEAFADDTLSADFLKKNLLPNEAEIIEDYGDYFQILVKGNLYSCQVHDCRDLFNATAKFKLASHDEQYQIIFNNNIGGIVQFYTSDETNNKQKFLNFLRPSVLKTGGMYSKTTTVFFPCWSKVQNES